MRRLRVGLRHVLRSGVVVPVVLRALVVEPVVVRALAVVRLVVGLRAALRIVIRGRVLGGRRAGVGARVRRLLYGSLGRGGRPSSWSSSEGSSTSTASGSVATGPWPSVGRRLGRGVAGVGVDRRLVDGLRNGGVGPGLFLDGARNAVTVRIERAVPDTVAVAVGRPRIRAGPNLHHVAHAVMVAVEIAVGGRRRGLRLELVAVRETVPVVVEVPVVALRVEAVGDAPTRRAFRRRRCRRSSGAEPEPPSPRRSRVPGPPLPTTAGLARPLGLTARARGTGQRHGHRGCPTCRSCPSLPPPAITIGVPPGPVIVTTLSAALPPPAERSTGRRSSGETWPSGIFTAGALPSPDCPPSGQFVQPSRGALSAPTPRTPATSPAATVPANLKSRTARRRAPPEASRFVSVNAKSDPLPRPLSASSKGCFSSGAIIFERFYSEMDERSTY